MHLTNDNHTHTDIQAVWDGIGWDEFVLGSGAGDSLR